MQHITRSVAAAVINELPSRFDTHMLEKRILRLHPETVAHELLAFRHAGDALHQFSAALARWVDTQFRAQIRQTSKVNSENLGGQESRNQEWEKLVGQIS
jgi:hypothetical protein